MISINILDLNNLIIVNKFFFNRVHSKEDSKVLLIIRLCVVGETKNSNTE